MRRQFTSRWPITAIAEQIVGLHQLVDLAGALVDDRALRVAPEPADGIFVGVAVRAVDLNRITRRALGRHRRKPLREPRFARVALALVLEPARSQPQQARRLVVRLHLRDHFLDQLMLADLDAERLALLGVFHARVAARTNQTRGARGDGKAPLVQREHRDLETLARSTDQVLFRHLDLVHLEEAGIAGEDAPLLLHRAAREPFERPLDDEGAQP
jgi:hypothetical protein